MSWATRKRQWWHKRITFFRVCLTGRPRLSLRWSAGTRSGDMPPHESHHCHISWTIQWPFLLHLYLLCFSTPLLCFYLESAIGLNPVCIFFSASYLSKWKPKSKSRFSKCTPSADVSLREQKVNHPSTLLKAFFSPSVSNKHTQHPSVIPHWDQWWSNPPSQWDSSHPSWSYAVRVI